MQGPGFIRLLAPSEWEGEIVLNKRFTATLEKSGKPGGWTYVVWPGSVEFFGTRGLVSRRRSFSKLLYGFGKWDA